MNRPAPSHMAIHFDDVLGGRSVRDTAAYRPEKFSAELRGQLRGSGGALMRKGRKDAQDPPRDRPAPSPPPPPHPEPQGPESAGCPSARHQPTRLSVISAELK